MAAQVQGASPEEIRDHYAWIKRVARALVNDPNVAGDLAQEAWLVALQSPPGAGVDLRTWLVGVLRNKAKHFWRGSGRRDLHERRAARSEEPSPSPEDLLASSEATQALIEEVHALHEPFRSTLLLSAMKEQSAVEIARQAGVPEGTVRWRLKRGRELLAERLDARYGNRHDWMKGFASLLLPAAKGSASISLTPLLVAGLCAATFLVPAAWYLTNRDTPEATAPALALLPQSADEANAELGPQIPVRQEAPAREPETSTLQLQVTDETQQATRPPRPQLDAGQAEVHVRLVTPGGRPLEGIQFELPGDHGTFARSDEDGWAVLRFRPLADSLRVHFLAGSNRNPSSGRATPVILPARVRTGVVTDLGEVVLHGSRQVQGRVLDDRGQPVEGASVFLGSPQDDLANQALYEEGPPLWLAYAGIAARTAPDGSFEMFVPDRAHRLWAGTPETRFGTPTHGASDGPVEIRLSPLDPSATIRGRVVGPDGTGIAGAQVLGLSGAPAPRRSSLQALPESMGWRFAPTGTRTGPDGSFQLLTRGMGPIQLRARDLEDRWEDEELEVSPGASDLLLRFEREL